MFRQRLLSALVGIPAVLAVAWAGGLTFLAVISLVGALALRELYEIGGVGEPIERILGYSGHLLLCFLAWFYGPLALFVGLIFFFIAVNIWWIGSFPREYKSLSVLVWGKIYITALLSCFFWVRQSQEGFLLITVIFVTVWASDTGAYLIGMTMGKHRLLPSVSPKKSFEGAIGGIIFAAAALGMMGPLLGMGYIEAIFTGILLSIVGQIGDLAESALKRSAHIKDSGHFLPGHGGVLDRLDSLLFVVPLAWVLFVIMK
jgi:phosphatidate cytidylyltransferase